MDRKNKPKFEFDLKKLKKELDSIPENSPETYIKTVNLLAELIILIDDSIESSLLFVYFEEIFQIFTDNLWKIKYTSKNEGLDKVILFLKKKLFLELLI